MVERRMSPKSLEGPIRIAQLSGEAAREGPVAFIGLMAMVSLNLAVFNLLPIPILDGGLILMLLIEMIMRRDLSMQVKEAVFRVGMVFLMAVVVFVLYNDISKILPGDAQPTDSSVLRPRERPADTPAGRSARPYLFLISSMRRRIISG